MIISTLPEGTYWWQVTPYYMINRTGLANPSEVGTFTINRQGELKPPVLYAPGNGEFVNKSKNSLTLSWGMENEASSYKVTVSAMKSLNFPTFTRETAENFITFKGSDVSSLKDGEYFWAVTQIDSEGNESATSEIRSFYAINGKIEQGVGGGICQASSTIYNAAIRAGLSIYERAPHEWASVYVPTGLDATIDYPNIDLKLENVSDYQVFLECKLVNYTLYATFWGVKNPDYDEIKVRNELGETKGSKYYVNAYRVYYKDGKKTGEKELPSSYYDLKNGKVFYPADNDAGAVDSDVDDITEPVVIPTQPQTSAQSSNDDTQSPVPETTAKATTQAETQTENQNNAEP